MRVTQNMLYQTTLNGILRNQERLLTYQTQVSTGKRILKASDGPLDMARVLSYREMISSTNQYIRNISRAKAWLSSTETALTQASELIRGARTLALQYANGTQSEESRKTAVQEVQAIIDSLIQLANTRVGNSYIFSGTLSTLAPFAVDGAYYGSSGDVVAEISQGVYQTLNLSGTDFLLTDLNPIISEPYSQTGTLAYEYSGMASGQRAAVSNYVLSSPKDHTRYDLTLELEDGRSFTVSFTTGAAATQDELGKGLARAVEQHGDLREYVEADYRDGVFTLTARGTDPETNGMRIRSSVSAFSTSHASFEGAGGALTSGFVLDTTNQSLVFSEKGYAAVNTVHASPSATVYTLEFLLGDVRRTVTLDYSGGPAPTQDELGTDLARAIQSDPTLGSSLNAFYEAGRLTVAVRTGTAGQETFSMNQGSTPVFDPGDEAESTFTLQELSMTVNLLEDSHAVRGVVYSGRQVAQFLQEAMNAQSAALGFSMSYAVEYDFIDSQETLDRFTIRNRSTGSGETLLQWSDAASTLGGALGFMGEDSSWLATDAADTSDHRVEFNVLAGVNDRFQINVDGGGFVTIVLDAGIYTSSELANHLQNRINAVTAGVGVTYSESMGGQFAVQSLSGGMQSTIRLKAGEGPDAAADFLRTVGLASESGLLLDASASGAGVVDSYQVRDLSPFMNPEAASILFRQQADGSWVVEDSGDFIGVTLVSSGGSHIEVDLNGDSKSDLRLNLSGWAAGDVLTLDFKRGYEENAYLEDGTDSVLLEDLNGGKGIRMDAPAGYVVVTGSNDQIRYVDEGGAYTLVIPPGAYTGEELARAMEAEFNSVGAADYRVSYSGGAFEIRKSSGTLELQWENVASTALGLLGFQADRDAGSLAYTSDHPVQTVHVSVMDRTGAVARVDISRFEVVDGENVISFDDGAPVSVTIPPGYYSGGQLAAVVESRLEEASSGGYSYTVTFRDDVFTLTRDDGAPVTFHWDDPNSAAGLLGFDDSSPVSGASSYTSRYVIPELTVRDVLERMNAEFDSAGLKITARINAAGNGLELVDTTTADERVTNLRVFGSASAADLGIYKEDRLITIDERTNTILFSAPPGVPGNTFKATLNPGTYTGNDMARVIQSALEQAVRTQYPYDGSPVSFSVEYFPERGVFSIIPSEEMEFHWTSSPLPSGDGSTAAAVLGITENWLFSGLGPFDPRYSNESSGAEGVPGGLVGSDLNPRLAGYTGVGDLYGGRGVQAGTVRIANGGVEYEVDLGGSRNLRELMARINATDAQVKAAIHSRGASLTLESLVEGSIPVVSSAGDTTAQLLGLSAGHDLLGTLYDFKSALEANDVRTIGSISAALDAGLQRLEDGISLTGIRIRQVEETEQFLEKYMLDLRELLSASEDVDITEAVTRLLNQETAFEAALQTAARLFSLSLLNFLT